MKVLRASLYVSSVLGYGLTKEIVILLYMSLSLFHIIFLQDGSHIIVTSVTPCLTILGTENFLFFIIE